ncbi:sensor histidine kinase [Sphingomicrobium clamense]|uniref:histidine kinase n=1 Tax=Sphingomicrobium clamense TaxID=2851013 RepID=A0ABS6V495_9SPHN|nr:ATP-binding protein [Sphingomicrobium sp. B8]MBW0144326.1 GHKL domain-containing protein [Sphingomicrobium sp. B8]
MTERAALLDAISEPALLVRGHRLEQANRAARDIFARRLVHNDIRLAIRHPAVLAAIESGKEASLDVEGIGGVDRPWRVILTPLEDSTLLIRMIDRGASRAAERMRVDFVANASHELRTPLTTIRGYAETLADDAEIDPELRQRFAKTIETESIRMLRIVEDLMDLSRIEADRFVRPRDKVDLPALVEDAVDANQDLANRSQCRVRTEMAEDVPAIVGDVGQLRQVLDNLISNALRYGCSPEKPAVAISVRKEGRFVRLIVRDEGEGIAADHLPRLTERFYRADEARSRESGGTGLGLAIVKHIVERHRGILDIASSPGHGTTVTIALPLAE